MRGFNFYLIKPHKQIPIDPQSIWPKSTPIIQAQQKIQLKLQVFQTKFLNLGFDLINKKFANLNKVLASN
jgi:hypothetical protein